MAAAAMRAAQLFLLLGAAQAWRPLCTNPDGLVWLPEIVANDETYVKVEAANRKSRCAQNADGWLDCWGEITRNNAPVQAHFRLQQRVSDFTTNNGVVCAYMQDSILTCNDIATALDSGTPSLAPFFDNRYILDSIAIEKAKGNSLNVCEVTYMGNLVCRNEIDPPASITGLAKVVANNYFFCGKQREVPGSVDCWLHHDGSSSGDESMDDYRVLPDTDSMGLVYDMTANGWGGFCWIDAAKNVQCHGGWSGDLQDRDINAAIDNRGAPFSSVSMGSQAVCALREQPLDGEKVVCWGPGASLLPDLSGYRDVKGLGLGGKSMCMLVESTTTTTTTTTGTVTMTSATETTTTETTMTTSSTATATTTATATATTTTTATATATTTVTATTTTRTLTATLTVTTAMMATTATATTTATTATTTLAETTATAATATAAATAMTASTTTDMASTTATTARRAGETTAMMATATMASTAMPATATTMTVTATPTSHGHDSPSVTAGEITATAVTPTTVGPASISPVDATPATTTAATAAATSSLVPSTATATATTKAGLKLKLRFSGVTCGLMGASAALQAAFIAAVEEGILASLANDRIRREHISTRLFCSGAARRLQGGSASLELVESESVINAEAISMPAADMKASLDGAGAAGAVRANVEARIRSVEGIAEVTKANQLPAVGPAFVTSYVDVTTTTVSTTVTPNCDSDICVEVASAARRGAAAAAALLWAALLA